MTKNWMLSTAILAVCVTAVAGAQSMKDMAKPSNGHMTSATYTGCVASANDGRAFLLTSTAGVKPMHGDMAMKAPGDMAMKGDAGTTMEHEKMSTADDKKDANGSKTYVLTGATNLEKHVGQKIAVTGSLSEDSMEPMHQPMLTVKSLKVIAKSCW